MLISETMLDCVRYEALPHTKPVLSSPTSNCVKGVWTLG